MIPTWPQNDAQMTGPWSENDQKMTRKWPEHDRKMTGKWPENDWKMTGKWPENNQNMTGKWRENDRRITRKMTRIWPENEANMNLTQGHLSNIQTMGKIKPYLKREANFRWAALGGYTLVLWRRRAKGRGSFIVVEAAKIAGTSSMSCCQKITL